MLKQTRSNNLSVILVKAIVSAKEKLNTEEYYIFSQEEFPFKFFTRPKVFEWDAINNRLSTKQIFYEN